MKETTYKQKKRHEGIRGPNIYSQTFFGGQTAKKNKLNICMLDTVTRPPIDIRENDACVCNTG